jgi:nickel-dependent lactate racemase
MYTAPRMSGPLAREVGPREIPPGIGHGSAAEAIDALGALPGGAEVRAVLVVVNDPARATRTAEVLAALRARAPGRPFELLVATGSHRWDRAARDAHEVPLLAAVGEPVAIHWHDGHDPSASSALPRTGRLLSSCYQRLAPESDVVVVGSVEPHWFAGLTGGHKALTVGIAPVAEIARNHRHALSPLARPFVLEGNPVFDDLRPVVEESVALAVGGRVLAVQHCALRWLAGDPLGTLRALGGAARARWLRRVPRPLDFVVSHVGPPLSRSLYQAEKAVKHAEHAVRDGGLLVLVAGCEEGIGPPRFVEMMAEAPDEASMLRAIDRVGYRLGDHKAVRLRRLLERGVRLVVVSRSFDPAEAAVAGFRVVPSLDALRGELKGEGAVVEDGAHCVLEVGPA